MILPDIKHNDKTLAVHNRSTMKTQVNRQKLK